MKKSVFLLFFAIHLSLLAAATPDSVFFSHDATHVLGNKDGDSWLFSWNAGCSADYDKQSVTLTGTVDYFTSPLSLVNGDILSASLANEINSDGRRFFFDLQVASSDKMMVTLGKPRFYQEGLSFLSGTAGLTVGKPVSLEPFFIFTDIASQKGSFYFFNGKIEGPPVKAAGVNVNYKNHSASFLYGSSHISVLEPIKDLLLGTIDMPFLNAAWTYGYKAGNWNLSSSLGYIGIYPDITLGLTKSNQKYLGFPFNYMNFTINGRIDTISFSQKNSLVMNNGELSFDLTGIFCFYSDFSSCIQWQYKDSTSSLYQALFESLSITADSYGHIKTDHRDLQNMLIMLPEIAYDYAVQNRTFTLDISASKQFPLAFKFKNEGTTVLETWTSDNKEFPLAADFNEFITVNDVFSSAADYLLSGLTLSIAVHY